jgi:hypothetical protein
MAAEATAAEQFIRAQLTGSSALVAMVPGGFHSERVHAVPVGRYVLWSSMGPSPDTLGEHGVRILSHLLYIVRVVDKVQSYLPLSPAADLIDQLLHAVAPSAQVVNGANYTIQSCLRERPYSLTQPFVDLEWRHLGGYYNITLSPY